MQKITLSVPSLTIPMLTQCRAPCSESAPFVFIRLRSCLVSRVLFSFSLSFICPFYASCFCPLVILCLIVCVFLLLFFFPSPCLCSLCYPLYNYFYRKIIKIRKIIVYSYTIYIIRHLGMLLSSRLIKNTVLSIPYFLIFCSLYFLVFSFLSFLFIYY